MKHKFFPLLIICFCLAFIHANAQQIGIASFYAKTVKSKMANGQRYHKDSMICAHRTHPFGTRLKVTHLKNHKFVIVKVTDRGPFGRGRIVDLSWGAAEKLGMLAAGLAKVKVEVFNGLSDSEIDTHPNDSTDLFIDYENREQYEFPYMPQKKEEKHTPQHGEK
ncbi:MAG: septal ring lytic transglycosylase RlpA family protein [Bacteroidaceae bacterium]